MAADIHANLLNLVDQSTPEGRAVVDVLHKHRPHLSDAWSAGGERRPALDMQWCVTCQQEWPCWIARGVAKELNVKSTVTMNECIATGGHYWVFGGGGVTPSHAMHWQLCIICPAMREGRKLLYRDDAGIVWDEPKDRRVST